MEKLERKRLLDIRIKKCDNCLGLNIKGETENAPGYGNLNSPVMIIGQSLCTSCMHTQIPFTGGSGLILDKIFALAGVKKEDLFITNLVHCHPPKNRQSLPEEIICCKPYLEEEIDIVNPLLIIGLGNDVKSNLFSYRDRMDNMMAYQLLYRNINGKFAGRHTCFVYHPAYVDRQGGMNSEYGKVYVEFFVDLLRRFI